MPLRFAIRWVTALQEALPGAGGQQRIEHTPLGFVADLIEQHVAHADVIAVVACPIGG